MGRNGEKVNRCVSWRANHEGSGFVRTEVRDNLLKVLIEPSFNLILIGVCASNFKDF